VLLQHETAAAKEEPMRNSTIVTAVVVAAIVTTACEKIPTGRTNQSGDVTSKVGEQAKRLRTEPQQYSRQTPTQAAPVLERTDQASDTSQAAGTQNEQRSKLSQSRDRRN
jgi:hypothetical protein